MSQASLEPRRGLTPVQWLICTMAAIGFAFDIYELLMLPLIARPALMELGGLTPADPRYAGWISALFYVPAVAGGIFGLLGGYLTDRLGRRRVLTWSILLYAFSAFAAGFSTSLYMLLFFRCLVFIGVCVEFVAAVAWLAELFDDPRQREGVLGFTQAFSSIGGLLVAVANGIAIAWAVNQPAPLLFGLKLPALQLPAVQLPEFLTFLGTVSDPHAPWRYTLMSGLIPAFPLIVIRPFLPESPAWQRKREAGTLKRPSIAALFSPELKRTTIITTIMFACSFAAAFGAIQQMPQIVPGLKDVRDSVQQARGAKGFTVEAEQELRESLAADGQTEAEINKAVLAKLRPIAGPIEQAAAAKATKVQEIGGLAGRFALAILILYVVGRGRLLRMFLVPGLVIMPLVFGWAGVTNLDYLEIGMFAAGFLTVAQFSFWGNYLPHVYPMHLRGTGESFAANIGGRLIGTCFFGVTQFIATLLPISALPATRVAYAAAGVAFTVYLINFILSFFLPEPKHGEMMD
jgi:MFS family permease